MSKEPTLQDFGNNSETRDHLELGPVTLDIPPEWDTTRFGDLFDHERGVNYSSDHYVAEGEGMVFLTLNAIAPGGGLKKDSLKFYYDDIKAEKLVEEGDILMANTDLNQDGEIIGYPVRVPSFDFESDVCFSHHLLKIQQKEKTFDSQFLEYLLSAEYVHNRMISFSCGSTVLNLNTGLLQKLELPIPTLEEQRKIASVLYTVDQAIEKTEEISQKLARLKQGAVQDLFKFGLNGDEVQKVRIGEFPEDWDFSNFRSVTEIYRGDTPDTGKEEYYGGDIIWVTPDDLSQIQENGLGKYISDSRRCITELGLENANTTVTDSQTVVFTSRSYGIGRTAICTKPAAMNQGITAIQPGNEVDLEFLYYYITHIMDYIISISGVSTFPEISKSDVGNLPVPIPSMREQRRIAEILMSFDDCLSQELAYKGKLERIKQGLMQDLLSGEIRTQDKPIEVIDEVLANG